MDAFLTLGPDVVVGILISLIGSVFGFVGLFLAVRLFLADDSDRPKPLRVLASVGLFLAFLAAGALLAIILAGRIIP